MRKLAGGHFFLLDLRNHHQRHLRLAETGGTRKAEHDMRALKRSDTDELRGGEPTGRKVIITWDKAGIDFTFWHTVKQTAGLYFISREKENVDNEGERKRKAKRRKEDEENGGITSPQHSNASPYAASSVSAGYGSGAIAKLSGAML
jgi:hypothetical protein